MRLKVEEYREKNGGTEGVGLRVKDGGCRIESETGGCKFKRAKEGWVKGDIRKLSKMKGAIFFF